VRAGRNDWRARSRADDGDAVLQDVLHDVERR
jgi:hypothetical protein